VIARRAQTRRWRPNHRRARPALHAVLRADLAPTACVGPAGEQCVNFRKWIHRTETEAYFQKVMFPLARMPVE